MNNNIRAVSPLSAVNNNNRTTVPLADPDVIGYVAAIIFLIGGVLSVWASIVTLRQKAPPLPIVSP